MRLLRVSKRLDGRFDFTSELDGYIRPVGYCAGYETIAVDESIITPQEWIDKNEKYKDNFHTHGHNTEEEAAECYRKYQLDFSLVLNNPPSSNYRKCKVCEKLTNNVARLGMKHWYLCEEHNTREEIEKLYNISGKVLMWAS